MSRSRENPELEFLKSLWGLGTEENGHEFLVFLGSIACKNKIIV
jgi:hypothetical protein